MKKINKNSINLSLKILTILAFGLIFMPLSKASAAYGTNALYQTNDGYFSGVPASNPQPAISSINPGSSNVGVGTKTVTITGSGFVPSSVVRINGTTRPATFIDASHLLLQINGNDTMIYRTNGGFFITVFNGAPGGGYSNAAFFTINTIAVPATDTSNVNNYSAGTVYPDNFTDTVQPENTTNTNFNDNYSNLASNAIFGSNSFLPSGLIQWVLFAIVILLIVIIVRKVFGAKKNYDDSPMKHA